MFKLYFNSPFILAAVTQNPPILNGSLPCAAIAFIFYFLF
ncbi:hypothetical protein [Salmonella phage SD-1_S14]|nr:hypothetical protein [Salmonella phage SD-2_S15]WPK18941.1 hypothetical protein [Salmonella phage SD-6_S16]WPK19613.1 hypothetical protein [Salmonella phage SD-1_S14]WPK20635.1 hypothetical protein [Salmonella phage SD-15_S21]